MVLWFRAIALDLDSTLTTGGWPSTAVLDRLAALRADGVRILLVTGRVLADLDVEFPGLADQLDLVVGENGCVLRGADGIRRLADRWSPPCWPGACSAPSTGCAANQAAPDLPVGHFGASTVAAAALWGRSRTGGPRRRGCAARPAYATRDASASAARRAR